MNDFDYRQQLARELLSDGLEPNDLKMQVDPAALVAAASSSWVFSPSASRSALSISRTTFGVRCSFMWNKHAAAHRLNAKVGFQRCAGRLSFAPVSLSASFDGDVLVFGIAF
jgi:hypothetical protein